MCNAICAAMLLFADIFNEKRSIIGSTYLPFAAAATRLLYGHLPPFRLLFGVGVIFVLVVRPQILRYFPELFGTQLEIGSVHCLVPKYLVVDLVGFGIIVDN